MLAARLVRPLASAARALRARRGRAAGAPHEQRVGLAGAGAARVEPLEQRALMTVSLVDASFYDGIDLDNDNYVRSAVFAADLRAEQPRNIFFRLIEEDSGSDDIVFISRVFEANTTTRRFEVPLVAERFNLPGDEGLGTLEFRLEAFDAGTGTLIRSWTRSDDASLAGVGFEDITADGGAFDPAPGVGSLSRSPGSLREGDTLTVSARVTQSGTARIVGAFAWLDLNRDGRFNGADDGPALFALERTSGTASDGTWSRSLALPARLGTGQYRLYVTAYNDDARSTDSFTTVEVLTSQPPQVTQLASNPAGPGPLPSGTQVTFTATLSGGAAERVRFFRDANRNGAYDAGTDALLAEDTSSAGGWTGQVTLPADGSWPEDALVGAQAVGPAGAGAVRSIMLGAYRQPRVAEVFFEPATIGATRGFTAGARVQGGAAPASLVTFFRDVNENNAFDPGLDEDLGVGFTTDGGQTWRRGVPGTTGWPALARIVADLRDARGNWQSGALTSAVLRSVSAPVVTSITRPGVVTWNDSVTVTATVQQGTGGVVRALSFFLDRDENGAWTPGFDTDLGADFDGSNGWSVTFTVPETTGRRIGASAVDASGVWGNALTEAMLVNDRPVVTAQVSIPGVFGVGQQFTVTATVTDSDPRAVTFFRDANGNGRWDAFVDEDLGADFDGSNGWSRTLTVPGAWAGLGRVSIVASAVDTRNAWSIRNGATTLVVGPAVTSVRVEGGSLLAPQQLTRVNATVTGGTPRAVVFFGDLDDNGVWTPGVDTDLGADFNGADGWGLDFVVPDAWRGRTVRVIGNAQSQQGFWGVFYPLNMPVEVSPGPLVRTVNVGSGVINPGDAVSLVAIPQSPAPVRAVSFFFDRNRDGDWTPGVDTDLGADFDGSDGWSIVAPMPSFSEPGIWFWFGANAVDPQGRWGQLPGQSDEVRLNDPPRVTPGSASPPVVNLGGSTTISVRASDFAGVAAVTMFVDLDSNGRWTPGVDVDLGTAARDGTTGPVWDSVWRRAVTLNVGRGAFTILMDALDLDGRWSGAPSSVTVTVV